MSDYPMISIFLHLSQAPNPLPHVLSNTLLMHPVISLSAVSSGIFFLHTPEPSIPHSVSHIQNPNCILLFQVLSALHYIETFFNHSTFFLSQKHCQIRHHFPKKRISMEFYSPKMSPKIPKTAKYVDFTLFSPKKYFPQNTIFVFLNVLSHTHFALFQESGLEKQYSQAVQDHYTFFTFFFSNFF